MDQELRNLLGELQDAIKALHAVHNEGMSVCGDPLVPILIDLDNAFNALCAALLKRAGK